jgi:hypothetical protein
MKTATTQCRKMTPRRRRLHCFAPHVVMRPSGANHAPGHRAGVEPRRAAGDAPQQTEREDSRGFRVCLGGARQAD